MVDRKADSLKHLVISESKKSQNFDLSSSDFEKLVTSLRDGNEQLFEHIFLAHFQRCVSYLIRNDDAREEEAYDIVMDTIVQFRARLIAGKIRYGNLRFLFTSIARQELRRARIRKQKLPHLPKLGHTESSEKHTIDEETYQIMRRALKQMGRGCRDLLRMYYFVGQNLNDIAQQQERTAASVRQQKRRCILQLRNMVQCFLK